MTKAIINREDGAVSGSVNVYATYESSESKINIHAASKETLITKNGESEPYLMSTFERREHIKKSQMIIATIMLTIAKW